jgi:hypothetical protein
LPRQKDHETQLFTVFANIQLSILQNILLFQVACAKIYNLLG